MAVSSNMVFIRNGQIPQFTLACLSIIACAFLSFLYKKYIAANPSQNTLFNKISLTLIVLDLFYGIHLVISYTISQYYYLCVLDAWADCFLLVMLFTHYAHFAKTYMNQTRGVVHKPSKNKQYVMLGIFLGTLVSLFYLDIGLDQSRNVCGARMNSISGVCLLFLNVGYFLYYSYVIGYYVTVRFIKKEMQRTISSENQIQLLVYFGLFTFIWCLVPLTQMTLLLANVEYEFTTSFFAKFSTYISASNGLITTVARLLINEDFRMLIFRCKHKEEKCRTETFEMEIEDQPEEDEKFGLSHKFKSGLKSEVMKLSGKFLSKAESVENKIQIPEFEDDIFDEPKGSSDSMRKGLSLPSESIKKSNNRSAINVGVNQKILMLYSVQRSLQKMYSKYNKAGDFKDQVDSFMKNNGTHDKSEAASTTFDSV